jgi:hypothetical protein
MLDSKKSAYLQTLEYILDESGKKHYIYPMKTSHLYLVQELFGKIDDEYIIMNLPYERANEDGEQILDTERYDAMFELLEMALQEKRAEIDKWIDIKQIADVFAAYRCVSQLKKKVKLLENELKI